MPDPNQQGPMSWADLLNQFGGGAGGAGGSQGPVPAVSRGGGEFEYAANPFCSNEQESICCFSCRNSYRRSILLLVVPSTDQHP